MATKTKLTRALAKRIGQAKGSPVTAVVYAAIDSDKLTLSSFAARAAQRNRAVKDQLSRVMSRIQEWETQSGERATVAFRPDDAAAVVTAPAALFETLAGDEAVAGIDVEAA